MTKNVQEEGEIILDIREQILTKYKELNEHLEKIDLNQLCQLYSRQELNDFKSKLYDVRLRSLAYEIGEVTKKMKEEEYPELLGIHHYPVLKEIDFLSEEEKLELDKFLVKFVPNRDYVQSFWRVVKSTVKTNRLKEFLIEKGVVEERHVIKCPSCHQSYASIIMTNEQKNDLDNLLKSDADYEDLEKYLHFMCDDCFHELDINEINEFCTEILLKMIMKRDSSLDNV